MAIDSSFFPALANASAHQRPFHVIVSDKIDYDAYNSTSLFNTLPHYADRPSVYNGTSPFLFLLFHLLGYRSGSKEDFPGKNRGLYRGTTHPAKRTNH